VASSLAATTTTLANYDKKESSKAYVTRKQVAHSDVRVCMHTAHPLVVAYLTTGALVYGVSSARASYT